MNELQRDYGRRGVQLLAINSNDPHLYPDEDLSRMVERADEDGYAFPYVVDEGQRVSRAYGAECTFHRSGNVTCEVGEVAEYVGVEAEVAESEVVQPTET